MSLLGYLLHRLDGREMQVPGMRLFAAFARSSRSLRVVPTVPGVLPAGHGQGHQVRLRLEAAFNLLCWPILTTLAALFGRRPTETTEADYLA